MTLKQTSLSRGNATSICLGLQYLTESVVFFFSLGSGAYYMNPVKSIAFCRKQAPDSDYVVGFLVFGSG